VPTVAETAPLTESQPTDVNPESFYDHNLHHLSKTCSLITFFTKPYLEIFHFFLLGNLPIEINASHVAVCQAPLNIVSKYFLDVNCSIGKVTLTSSQTPPMTLSPSNEGLVQSVHQDDVRCPTERNPSTSNDAQRPCFTKEQSSCQQLATPLTSNGVPGTPEEVVPHPRVAQTGPRLSKNMNRGASHVLTNPPKIAKLKDIYYDLKCLKETNRLLKESIFRPKKMQKKVRHYL
jgi:hypothetical protein